MDLPLGKVSKITCGALINDPALSGVYERQDHFDTLKINITVLDLF